MMTRLMDFVTQWAQTPSDYDTLIARTFSADWAQEHLPILSQNGVHFMYTGYSNVEPTGLPLFCHNNECSVENQVWEVKKGRAHVQCLSCLSMCTVKLTALDGSTLLGHCQLLKVKFPTGAAVAEWKV